LVNNYEITLEDFMSQKQKYAALMTSGQSVKKKFIIDILIDNIILLMEAERMKLNQNGTFLKEIESFWRQSLISELMRTKTSEIREKIKISEEEIKQFHHYLQKEYYFRYLQLSDNQKDFTFSEEINYDDFSKKNKDLIYYDSGPNWIDLQSIAPHFRKELIRENVPLNKWLFSEDKNGRYLFCFYKEKEKTIADYKDMKAEIEMLLREEKERQLMEAWMNNLRKSVHLTVNEKLLSKI
jgi:hypothetical protein